VGLLA